MELRFGYLPAATITDPELLTRIIAELPPAMRYVLEGVRVDQPIDSPAFLASLDRVLPTELRRRYYIRDLVVLGAKRKTIEQDGVLRRAADGSDGSGRFWYYATLVAQRVIE